MDLISQRFQCSPDNMAFIYPSGQSYDGPSGILIPVGSSQSGKSRHYITAMGVLYFSGHILGIFRRIDHPEFISQPLDHSSCYKYRSLQSIGDLPVQSPCYGSYQSIFGKYRFFSCVHQQETAGTVSIFGISFFKTCLSEKGRLLIPCRPSDRDRSAEKAAVRHSIYAA